MSTLRPQPHATRPVAANSANSGTAKGILPAGGTRPSRDTHPTPDPRLARVVAEAELLLVAAGAEFEPEVRLAVADRHGVILATFGGGMLAGRLDAAGFRVGQRWSMPDRRDNAMALALTGGDPAVVRGPAHPDEQLHGFTTAAVAVPGPDGEVIAALGLMMPAGTAETRPTRPLRVAARAIRRMLAREAAAAPWTARHGTLETLLGHCDLTAVLLEAPGTVRAASPGGHALLERLRSRLGGDSSAGLQLDRLMGAGWAALVEAASDPLPRPVSVAIGGLEDERHLVHLDPVVRVAGEVHAVLAVLERPRPGRIGGAMRDVSVRTIVGSDPAFVASKRMAEQFARTDLPVLVVAETGSGKEVLARAIHDASPRAAEPFIAINCGSLSPQLLESELFGYGPGAFTGARPEGHEGKIRAADGGTLFLDEVAEMTPALQASLLRVLEDGTYYRVGETILRRSNIRIIAATWRDLPALIAQERFRPDLYYRIKGATITIPPLRRRSDIGDITNFLLDKLCFELKVPQARFSREAMDIIKRFPWPGNIRELRSAVHHAVVLGEGRRSLLPEHLPADVRTHHGPESPAEEIDVAGDVAAAAAAMAPPFAPPDPPVAVEPVAGESVADPETDDLEQIQRTTLHRVLRETGGNLSESARRLGVARSTLYRLMDRHGLRGMRA
jgi:DNA-binding NtrC family response regulator